MKKLIILAVIILGLTATTYAQLNAIAQITANIQSPSSITKVLDLNFGNIFTPLTATGGTVSVAPIEGLNRTATGVVLGTGSGQAAKFTITGTPLATVLLSLPTFTPITLFSGIDFMNVTLDYTNLSSNPLLVSGSTVSLTLDAGGTFTFWIGGTLHVSPNQAWGSYSNNTDLEFIINQ